MNLPNFIIAGASRAGSTTLYHLIKSHPEIFMPEKKELSFFGYDENYNRGINYYSSYFPVDAKTKIKGEATPSYIHTNYIRSTEGKYRHQSEDDTAIRVKKYLPGVKLIFTLRNPVRRMYSQYWKGIRNLNVDQSDSFLSLLKIKKFQSLSDENYILPLIYRNDYYSHLKKWFALFPNENIKVLIFEEWTQSPLENLEAIAKFLDVASFPKIDESKFFRNKGYTVRSKTLRRIERGLDSNIPSLNRIGSIIRKFNSKYSYPKISEEEYKFAFDLMSESIEKLEELLERDLSIWKE